MTSVRPLQAGVNSGPDVLRPSVAHEQPDTPTISQGVPVGYDFDPLPSTIRRDILLELQPIDHLVLAILISFAVWRRDSCWTTVKTVAARIRAIRPGRSGKATVCDRTVQRSVERLKAAGLIDHRRVPKPDPDQPANRTGWRFYFLWPIEARPARPGEVTNGPGEVTKDSRVAPSPAASPSGGVTSKSGDSIVTQDRGEVGESEPTFNVAALAGGGDGEPRAIVGTGSGGDVPAAAVWTPRELAEKLFCQLRDRGLILELRSDPERGEVIVPRRLTNSAEPIRPDEEAKLVRLRPHVLAFLAGRAGPAAAGIVAGPGPADESPPAPKVREPAKVRALIGRLAGNPDPAIEAAACRAIADALGDHKPESLAMFLGLAGDVRRGVLAEACLQESFGEACGRKVRDRGRAFTAAVKRRIWSARSKGITPGPRATGGSDARPAL